MSHYDLPQNTNFNFSSGIDQLFLYVANQVPIFFPSVLTAFFLIIFLGGMFAEQRLMGREEFLKWGSIAGLLTMGLSTIFAITSGLIGGLVLTINAIVAIIFMLGYAWSIK